MIRAADRWRPPKRSSWTRAVPKVDSFYTKTEPFANDRSPKLAYFRVTVGVNKGWMQPERTASIGHSLVRIS